MKKEKKHGSELGLVVHRLTSVEQLKPWADFLAQEGYLPANSDPTQWLQEHVQSKLHFFTVKKPKAREGFDFEGGLIAFSFDQPLQKLREELRKWIGEAPQELEIQEDSVLVSTLSSKAGFKLAAKTLVGTAVRVAQGSRPISHCIVVIPTSDSSSARALKSLGFENIFTSEKVQVYRSSVSDL